MPSGTRDVVEVQLVIFVKIKKTPNTGMDTQRRMRTAG
jgi:hypothetical protein